MPAVVEPKTGVLSEAVASGCFETMHAYEGKIFRLDAHIERLEASSRYLGVSVSMSRKELVRKLSMALKTSGLKEATVRVALLPQRSRAKKSLVSIIVQPSESPSSTAYKQGITAAVVPTKKFSVAAIDPRAKYSARISSILAIAEAQLRGVDEALFMDDLGCVTESTASNFGIIKNGRLLTPPCWLGLLGGITRDVTLEAAARIGVPVSEIPLTRHEVYTADEAFLSSTTKEILPIRMVDGRRIGSETPGPFTRRLQRAFTALVRKELGLQPRVTRSRKRVSHGRH